MNQPDPTTGPVRIPIGRSVTYVVRGMPEVPNQHGPGSLVPTEVSLTYRASEDSQLGRFHAYVKGHWRREDGVREVDAALPGQHYYGDPSDWPDWLAAEARLHDPERTAAPAPSAWIDGHPQLEAIAAAVWEQCGRSDSGACVDDDPRNIAVAALAAISAVPPAPAPQDDDEAEERRDQYSAPLYALMRRHGWDGEYTDEVVREMDLVLDAVLPVADAEQAGLRAAFNAQLDLFADTYDRHTKQIAEHAKQTEAYRLALSEALGLGTGAPWDAIQERTAELAAVPSAPTSRAACVCGQPGAPDVFHRQDGPCYQISSLHRVVAIALARVDAHSWADGVPLEEQAVWQDYLLRAAAVLAVLPTVDPAAVPAAEEQPENETPQEAHPAEHSWRAELYDPLAKEWAPGTRYADRNQAMNALAHGRRIGPAWKDGTPTERRLVRATTTYTVEATPPAVVPQPEETKPGTTVAYSGKGRAWCLTCPRPDGEDVPFTVDGIAPHECCAGCGRDLVDVARAVTEATPAKEA